MDKLEYLLSRREVLKYRADLYGEDLTQELRELDREILIQRGVHWRFRWWGFCWSGGTINLKNSLKNF